MKLKKLFSLILAGMLALGVTGCADTKAVSVDDLFVPTYQDAGEIVLRTDLPPNQSDREQMLQYLDCGFNAIPLTDDFCSSAKVAPYMDELAEYEAALLEWDGINPATKPKEPDKPDYVKALELCEELGVDVYIRPHSDFVAEEPENALGTKTYYEERFYNFDFTKYPAVKGFMMVDEPTYGKVTDLANRYLPWFNENYGDKGYEVLINHLSPGNNNWKDKYSNGLTYDDYIAHFYNDFLGQCNSVNKVFSHDGYVLKSDGTNNFIDDTHLFAGLKLKDYANQYGVDYGAYIQCWHSDSSDERALTSYADFSFQVCSYLAMGAKILSFYGYRNYGSENHLTIGGEKTDKWYWVQQVNQMVKKLDGVIFNFEWEGLYTNVGTGNFFETVGHFEAVKNLDIDSLDGVKSFNSKYNAIVGQYEDADGNKGFMLVNYEEPSIKHTNKVTMKFENADGVLLYRNGDPTTIGLKDKTFTIDLEAGEGVFIVPLNKK
ncbi:MAG: hypothetical protein IKB30_02905 [Clostridia bacterium]|nr:hypothetical protein [Clostridia bacterium]